jgi:hypothetical protein
MAESQEEVDMAPKPSDFPSRLPFPPLTKQHVLNCAVNSWHPRYVPMTIQLPPAF